MEKKSAARLAEPRLETPGALNLVGLSRLYPFEKVGEIPDQWQSFAPMIPQITGAPKPVTYGVIYNATGENFDYLTGVELISEDDLPDGLLSLELSPQTYLVFSHAGHLSTLRETCDAIWSDWLPASCRTAAEAPWFERYGSEFDPMTGTGGITVWIPVRS